MYDVSLRISTSDVRLQQTCGNSPIFRQKNNAVMTSSLQTDSPSIENVEEKQQEVERP